MSHIWPPHKSKEPYGDHCLKRSSITRLRYKNNSIPSKIWVTLVHQQYKGLGSGKKLYIMLKSLEIWWSTFQHSFIQSHFICYFFHQQVLYVTSDNHVISSWLLELWINCGSLLYRLSCCAKLALASHFPNHGFKAKVDISTEITSLNV